MSNNSTSDNSILERSLPYPDRFQLIGFIVPGTVFITGCIWGINGKIFSPEYSKIVQEMSFAALIVLVILSYVIGEVLSGLFEWIRYYIRHNNFLNNKPAWINQLTDRPYYNILICADPREGMKHVLLGRNYVLNYKNRIVSLMRLKFILASLLLEEFNMEGSFRKIDSKEIETIDLSEMMKSLILRNEAPKLTRRFLQYYYQHIKQTIIQHHPNFASELKSSQAKEKMFASMMLAGILVSVIAMGHCFDPASLLANTWYENPLSVVIIYAAISYMSYKMYLLNRMIYAERLFALYYLCIKENGTLDKIKSYLPTEDTRKEASAE